MARHGLAAAGYDGAGEVASADLEVELAQGGEGHADEGDRGLDLAGDPECDAVSGELDGDNAGELVVEPCEMVS